LPTSGWPDRPCATWAVTEIPQIAAIGQKVFRKTLGSRRVEDIQVEPRTDSLGDDALLVRVIISPLAVEELKRGDKVATARFEFGRQLELAGEERFPVVEYATREELATDGDTES
jgi:hypothetical protein